MKFWNKLQNPFVLVGQGFVFGGVLFFATHAESHHAAAHAAVAPAPAISSSIASR